KPLDLLLRRTRSDVGAARLAVETAAESVAQKVKRLVGNLARLRLGFIDRQLQLRHHRLHPCPRLGGGEPAADYESSGPGGFPPQARSDPDGRLSPHPALMIRSPVVSQAARGRTASDRVALSDPAKRLRG